MKAGKAAAEQARKAAKEAEGDAPKYVSGLLKAAEQRKKDRVRAEDKMIEREREREGGDPHPRHRRPGIRARADVGIVHGVHPAAVFPARRLARDGPDLDRPFTLFLRRTHVEADGLVLLLRGEAEPCGGNGRPPLGEH